MMRHRPNWRRRQRALFWQFAATFGAIMLLVVGGMALLAFVFTSLLGGSRPVALLTWFGGCSLLLVLPMLAFRVARSASRNITEPLADVMAAADSVAAGDLTVRVPENASREFGQLSHTFNRMVGELQRIDEQRRNLTADVAHELRTPLHVIQGNLEGILDGVYQPTPEHIQMLLDETRLLSRLVEDLRTLAQAESGHLPLHKERVQVADLLSDLATSFSAQAESAGISLRVEADGLAKTAIEADVMRLNQVLANLLVNALRYTPSGGSIALRGEPTSGGVRLIVSDTGEGIPPEDLPHVFDRFWRGDPARTHKDGAGAGLGLAIVKQLVELHGGDVDVQSIEIDLNGHSVTRRGQAVHLTPSEFTLLTVLAQHPGQVFSREQLLERLYGVAYDGFARSVDAHIKNLRQKLEDDPTNPRYVITIYGIGYKFNAEADS